MPPFHPRKQAGNGVVALCIYLLGFFGLCPKTRLRLGLAIGSHPLLSLMTRIPLAIPFAFASEMDDARKIDGKTFFLGKAGFRADCGNPARREELHGQRQNIQGRIKRPHWELNPGLRVRNPVCCPLYHGGTRGKIKQENKKLLYLLAAQEASAYIGFLAFPPLLP
jgi:hypothetical protein